MRKDNLASSDKLIMRRWIQEAMGRFGCNVFRISTNQCLRHRTLNGPWCQSPWTTKIFSTSNIPPQICSDGAFCIRVRYLGTYCQQTPVASQELEDKEVGNYFGQFSRNSLFFSRFLIFIHVYFEAIAYPFVFGLWPGCLDASVGGPVAQSKSPKE